MIYVHDNSYIFCILQSRYFCADNKTALLCVIFLIFIFWFTYYGIHTKQKFYGIVMLQLRPVLLTIPTPVL